jgi:hypothetical protein
VGGGGSGQLGSTHISVRTYCGLIRIGYVVRWMNQPPPLSYDTPRKVGMPRMGWIVFAYAMGVMGAELTLSVVTAIGSHMNWFARDVEGLLQAVFVYLGASLVILVPSVLFLGITLWLKARLGKVQEPRVRWSFLAGMMAGLLSLPLIRMGHDDQSLFMWMFIMLALNCLYPTLAGWLLLRRIQDL